MPPVRASPPSIGIMRLLFCCWAACKSSRRGNAQYAREAKPRSIKMIPTIEAAFMGNPWSAVNGSGAGFVFLDEPFTHGCEGLAYHLLTLKR